MDHDQRRFKVTLTAQAKAMGEAMAPVVEQQCAELQVLVGVQALPAAVTAAAHPLPRFPLHQMT